MALALKTAWAMAKNTKRTMEQVAEMIKEKAGNVQVNIWERYGKRRIYVNKGFRNNVAMLEFDEQDNYIGKKFDNMDLVGARQAGWENEFLAVKEVIEQVA